MHRPDMEYLKLSRKDFKDYEYILGELERVASLDFPQIRAHLEARPGDLLPTVRNPKNSQPLLLPRAADRRFWQAAKRGLTSLGPDGRKYDIGDVVSEMKDELLTRYLGDPASITDENAHEVFRTAIDRIASSFRPLTHHIPCNVVTQTKPPQFSIGPVLFRLIDNFWTENEQAIRRAAATPKSIDLLEKFLKSYRWVASVSVGPSAPRPSEQKAREAVRAGLNLLKLIIGSDRASAVGHAYGIGAASQTASLTSDEAGFHLSHQWKGSDAILKDDWLDDISGSPMWEFGQEAIHRQLAAWDKLPDPEQRFLDALSWHGDAISEQQPSARIIKFWTAIERVVSLRANDEVTERAAVLSVSTSEGFAAHYRACQRLYSLRSEILHGTPRSGDQKLAASARETEDISQGVLTSYGWFAARATLAKTLTADLLRVEFKRIEEIAAKWIRAERT